MSQQKEELPVLEFRKRRRLLLPTYSEGRDESQPITGPLGIWPFPLLNALLQFLLATRTRAIPPPQAYLPRTASRRVEYIRDKMGRIVEKYEEIEVT